MISETALTNTPADDLTQLRERIERLEAIKAIETLKYTYARYCDAGYDADAIAQLFVEGGRWIVDGSGKNLEGHTAIHKHFEDLSQKITWARHHIIAPTVEVSDDGEHAVGQFYLLCLCTVKNTTDPNQDDAVILTIDYTDKFIRRDGQWFFEELVGHTHQASNWDQGWVKQAFRQ